MPRNLFRSRRRKVAAIVTVLALMVAGVAFAAWVVLGSGSASGKAGQLQAPTFTALDANSIPNSDRLFPGGTGAVAFSVNNPNASALILTTLNGGSIASDTSGCAAYVTFVPQTGLSIPLPAGGSNVSVPGALAMASNADSGCQNASFSLLVNGSTRTP